MGNQIYNNFTFVASSSDNPAGRDQYQITIITAYCPCKQYDPGDSTINAQQCRVLRQQGINNPNTCNKWGKYLIPLLKQWKHEGK
eukprot:12689956-Ditylum_brightwellii.AAC.1